MKNNQKKVRYMTQGAMIAALYVVMTFLAHLFGLDSGVIQLRLSEALTALLFFTPAAIPGITIGCLLSNIFVGCVFWDVVCGTLATLIGAWLGYLLRKHRYLVLLPNIVSNTIIIPFVLKYVYVFPGSLGYFVLTVGVGEILSCGVLGMILLRAIEKKGSHIFRT